MPELIAKAYIKANVQTIQQVAERIGAWNFQAISLDNGLPLEIFGNDTPILWQLNGDEPQALKDFLYHLKDQRNRHVILGNASDLLNAADSIWPTPESHMQAATPPTTPANRDPPPAVGRMASVIFSGPVSSRLDAILAICGYVTSHDTIPMDKSRIEQATIVILVASAQMFPKFSKIQGILASSLKKDVILLEELRCEDMLTQLLASRGELPGWSTGTSTDMLENPKLVDSMENHVSLLLNLFGFEQDMRSIKAQDLDPQKESMLNSLSLWYQKSCMHSLDPRPFTPWTSPMPPQGNDDLIHNTGVSLNMSVSSLHASRSEVLAQCEVLLRASGLPGSWGPLRDQALPLLKNLMFRQAMVRAIQRVQASSAPVQPKAPEKKVGGWFANRERSHSSEETQATEGAPVDPKVAIRQCETERGQITKVLVEAYWSLYTKAFSMWPDINMCEQAAKIRSFLRTGFLGHEFLDYSKDQIDIIRKMTEAPSGPWEYSGHERHVLYADELAEAIRLGRTGTGLDEELELNGKGSEDWKASRRFRQKAALLRHQGVCRRKIEELSAALKDLDSRLQVLDPSTQDGRSRLADPALRDLKVQRARLQEHLDVSRKLSEGVPMATLSAQGDEKETPKDHLRAWLEREAGLLRRYSKLCAELKEHFIPDVIQRELTPDTLKLGMPSSVISCLGQLEELDGSLFDVVLSGARKPEGRLTATISPTFIILPGSGQMSFVAEPHDELTEGRICLPLISQNPRGLMGLLIQAAADFRWDSAMAEAGPEWVTSESLVGAYSRTRWDYRRLEKDARERALVYKEENDRKNFRRHYQLYLTSAKEQGRLLYYKSKSLYAAINKHIPLPPGVSRMET